MADASTRRIDSAPAPAPYAKPSARIDLIGGFAFSAAGRPVLFGLRAQALIAMLALAPRGGVERAEAARLIWADAAPERARASLRQGVRAVRQTLDDVGLGAAFDAGPTLTLERAWCDTDVDDVLRAAEAGVAHPALLGEIDPFARLHGLDGAVGAAFADWVAARAEALRRAVRRALSAPASAPEAERDRAQACALLDPADEGAARRAMAAHAALGETHRALGVYDRLWRALDARFGAEPGPETQGLLARIRHGRPAPRPSTPDRAAPLLRVLPGVATPRAGATAMAAALRLDFAAAAARLPGWDVRVSDAVGETGTHARIGVVESADGFAFVLTLDEADTGRVFWAAREPADLSGVVRAARAAHAAVMAAHGAPAVLPSVEGGALERLTRRRREAGPAPMPEAHDLLAAALTGAPPTLDAVAAALAAAHAGVDAEPLSAAARLRLGWAQLFARDFAQGAETLALAAELDPTAPEALRSAALGLALAGEATAARALLADAAAIAEDEADVCAALAAALLGDRAPARSGAAMTPERALRLIRALPVADARRSAAPRAASDA